MQQQSAIQFAAYVGIDWADRKHDICLEVPGVDQSELSVIEHRPTKIQEWAEALRQRFGGAPIAVGIELSHGPIVSALLEYDFLVLFPIQPITLARYRTAFSPSRAKDDPTDAQLAVDLIRRHPERFKPLELESASMRSLRRLVEARRALVQDRVRVTNRLTFVLKTYFPQVLAWFSEKDTKVFMDFIERWPTLQAAKRARRETLVEFFNSHRVRRTNVIEKRIKEIKSELPLTNDEAVINSSSLIAQAILPQLRALVAAIRTLDAEISRLCDDLPDYKIFASLPGAGGVFAPRLLTAFGENRERFPDAAAMQKYAGVAPVTVRSGTTHRVHWRWACTTFLRQTFVEWVAHTIPKSFWAKTFYERQRSKGAPHQAALRALAFKWVRILWRCWVDRVPYDESRYLNALKKRHSPLLAFAAQTAS